MGYQKNSSNIKDDDYCPTGLCGIPKGYTPPAHLKTLRAWKAWTAADKPAAGSPRYKKLFPAPGKVAKPAATSDNPADSSNKDDEVAEERRHLFKDHEDEAGTSSNKTVASQDMDDGDRRR